MSIEDSAQRKYKISVLAPVVTNNKPCKKEYKKIIKECQETKNLLSAQLQTANSNR